MIDPIFQVHKLNEKGLARAFDIASAFNNLLVTLGALGLGTGREFSIVKTKLEEACFFARKALANQPDNQLGG